MQDTEVIDTTVEEVIETPPAEQPQQEGPSAADDRKEDPAPKAALMIPIDARGKVMARNQSELMRYCGAMVQGGGVPERFNTPQKLFAALMFVRDLRLPDTAIRQVAVVHGVMCAFGDLPLGMAQNTGKLKKLKEQWFDSAYKVICFEEKNLNAEVFGAVCFAAREDGEVQSFSFTLDDAKKAGLYPAMKWDKQLKKKVESPDSPWMKYTKVMLRYRARSLMLKSLFPDAITGVGIAEYDFDEAPEFGEMKDVTPSQDRDAIAERLAKRAAQQNPKEGDNG